MELTSNHSFVKPSQRNDSSTTSYVTRLIVYRKIYQYLNGTNKTSGELVLLIVLNERKTE